MSDGVVKHLRGILSAPSTHQWAPRVRTIVGHAGTMATVYIGLRWPALAILGVVTLTLHRKWRGINKVRRRAHAIQAKAHRSIPGKATGSCHKTIHGVVRAASWPMALVKEKPVTAKQKRDAWWRDSHEAAEAPAVPTIVSYDDKHEMGESWYVKVPTIGTFNASTYCSDKMAAALRHESKGICFGVKMNVDTTNPGHARVLVLRRNITDVEAGPAPVLAAPPTTIGDRVQIGLTAMRNPATLDLRTDCIGVFGLPGGGKSTLLHLLIAHAASTQDTDVYLADLKDGIDGAVWSDTVHYTEDLLECRRWIARYCTPNEDTYKATPWAQARARHLKALGLRKWEPGCGLRFELLVIDEVDNLTKDDQLALAWVVKKHRAIGVRVIIATQDPAKASMERNLVSNLTARVAFRVESTTVANVALRPGAVGMGADASKLPSPGYAYVLGATDQEATVIRIHYLTEADVETIVKRLPRLEPSHPNEPATEPRQWAIETPPMDAAEIPNQPSPNRGPLPAPIGRPLERPAPVDLITRPAVAAAWDALLRMDGWMAPKDLCAITGYKSSSLGNALRALEEEGFAERRGAGRGTMWRRRVHADPRLVVA
jgi:hypothetical protein